MNRDRVIDDGIGWPDAVSMVETRPMPQRSTAPPTTLDRGRAAFDRQAWADARDLLSAADREAPLGARGPRAPRHRDLPRRRVRGEHGDLAPGVPGVDPCRGHRAGRAQRLLGGRRASRARRDGAGRRLARQARSASSAREAASGSSRGTCWSPPRRRAWPSATRARPGARTNEPPRSARGSPTPTWSSWHGSASASHWSRSARSSAASG